MAINLYTRYPNNTPAADADYPIGKARNETFDGAKDYFPLEATWVNELLGFLGALLNDSGASPNGQPEKKLSSQYLQAIKTMDVSLDRLTSGNVANLSGNITMGIDTQGIIELDAGASSFGSFKTRAPTTKTNKHTITLRRGNLEFAGAPGFEHLMFPILWPINSVDVSFNATATPYILVEAQTFTGINYGIVYRTELVMNNASNIMTVPLIGDYYSSGGTLALAEAHGAWSRGGTIAPSSYTSFYLHLWINPNFIS